jgi:glycerophosphoryl diester phosphodiesterase
MKKPGFTVRLLLISVVFVVSLQQKTIIAREKFDFLHSNTKWYDGLNISNIEEIASFFTGITDDKTTQTITDSFPKPKNGNVYVIAHRGAHIGIPENTLAAYKKAINLDCDFVEIDVRRTRDGRFVSVHNATIDAYVEGKSGRVADFTLAELKQMNIGKRVGPGWENERIPTFEEILQLCRGQIGIYLDLKEPNVEELVSIIKSYGMERDIVWYIPASYMEAILLVKNNCYKCVPMPDPGPAKNIEKVVKLVHPLVISTDMGKLNEDYVRIAHKNNAKVFTDDKKGTVAEWTKILNWGTDGIQTDDPEGLIRFLRKRGK